MYMYMRSWLCILGFPFPSLFSSILIYHPYLLRCSLDFSFVYTAILYIIISPSHPTIRYPRPFPAYST